MSEVCESTEELMDRCTKLAFDLAYCELNSRGSYFTPREIDDDEVWMWADGLYQSWFHDRMEGRCSLQATIDFDIAAEEEKMKALADRWTKLLEELGPPVKLTKEEMRKRGYRYD